MLRDYQQRAIDQLYSWFQNHPVGDPCIEMPTGAGKSHVIAALCKDALQSWPETRILILSHVKELLEQDAEKIRHHWPNAPMGIYSAGLKQKMLGEPITVAGIQSVRTKALDIGHIDIMIVDECHLINHKAEGGYRQLIGELRNINLKLRVIGLTATPYRLGHGLITDQPAIFTDLIKPVSIEELIARGFLAPLRSKHTQQQIDTSQIKKRGGEFIQGQLEAAVDQDDLTKAAVAEIVRRASGRKSWLIFCAGISHSQNVRDELRTHGIISEMVTGETPAAERRKILDRFRKGSVQALTNANVLTTGFDHPGIDLLAFLRPTMSPSLYVQMAGRGMRIDPCKDDCLVLDFAGNVERHGPITAVEPPRRSKDEPGDAPTKTCPKCDEILHASVKICPQCGYTFPAVERAYKLSSADILGLDATKMIVRDWQWRAHTSRASGKEMVKVTYYPQDLAGEMVTEYLPITHSGVAGERARRTLVEIASRSGVEIDSDNTKSIVESLNRGRRPENIEYHRDGKFFRVTSRTFGKPSIAPGRQDLSAQDIERQRA